MKLIRCTECGDAVALSRTWRNCDCGLSGGAYKRDMDTALVAGPCGLYGIANGLFYGRRVEAWPYDESNGKIERIVVNPGRFPERSVA